MGTALPSTRQLLTSLLNTLATTPASQQPSTQANEPYSVPSNSLKNLPPSQRALLTTLHVLFPPPMLLQALDLLDRGLVLRVIEKASPSFEGLSMQAEGEAGRQAVYPPQANIHLPPNPSLPRPNSEYTSKPDLRPGNKGNKNTVYQVRSSQPPKSRFKDTGAAATGNNVYTVRLEAWNCSCAAFAFSAFPGGGSGGGRPWTMGDRDEEDLYELRGGGDDIGTEKEWEGKGEEWEFGGLSGDGRAGGGVPVCKHLVACILGERWDVLEGYIQEREMSRDEMGGVSGEG